MKMPSKKPALNVFAMGPENKARKRTSAKTITNAMAEGTLDPRKKSPKKK